MPDYHQQKEQIAAMLRILRSARAELISDILMENWKLKAQILKYRRHLSIIFDQYSIEWILRQIKTGASISDDLGRALIQRLSPLIEQHIQTDSLANIGNLAARFLEQKKTAFRELQNLVSRGEESQARFEFFIERDKLAFEQFLEHTQGGTNG